jgi:hypothetical protein
VTRGEPALLPLRVDAARVLLPRFTHILRCVRVFLVFYAPAACLCGGYRLSQARFAETPAWMRAPPSKAA